MSDQWQLLRGSIGASPAWYFYGCFDLFDSILAIEEQDDRLDKRYWSGAVWHVGLL